MAKQTATKALVPALVGAVVTIVSAVTSAHGGFTNPEFVTTVTEAVMTVAMAGLAWLVPNTEKALKIRKTALGVAGVVAEVADEVKSDLTPEIPDEVSADQPAK